MGKACQMEVAIDLGSQRLRLMPYATLGIQPYGDFSYSKKFLITDRVGFGDPRPANLAVRGANLVG